MYLRKTGSGILRFGFAIIAAVGALSKRASGAVFIRIEDPRDFAFELFRWTFRLMMFLYATVFAFFGCIALGRSVIDAMGTDDGRRKFFSELAVISVLVFGMWRVRDAFGIQGVHPA
ncbi:hypothetical protein MTO96_043109 [Rhipicephalus appendiculatus]